MKGSFLSVTYIKYNYIRVIQCMKCIYVCIIYLCVYVSFIINIFSKSYFSRELQKKIERTSLKRRQNVFHFSGGGMDRHITFWDILAGKFA
jgi:hypothetical protein